MRISPFRHRLQYLLESILLSGTLGRLSIAALAILVTALTAGMLVFSFAQGTEHAFSNPFEAAWWAFLRLSDPGYLGDDEGLLLRTVSTVLTVGGYVLFLGVLVAILTQGLNEKIRKLEMGTTPVSARKHIILLGWTNRTPRMVRNFVLSEARVQRFLRRIGARRLKLLLLIEEVGPEHWVELRAFLGRDRRKNGVIMRSGTPLRLEHLMRVDFLRASAIVLAAQSRTGRRAASESDNAAVKTVLSISHSLRFAELNSPPPMLVVELHDPCKVPTVLGGYRGPIEVISSDQVLSQILVQMARNPRISFVIRELLSQGVGSEFFVRDCPPVLVGKEFWQVASTLADAILIGVTWQTDGNIQPLLNPPVGHRLGADQKLVYVARTWDDLEFIEAADKAPVWPVPKPKPKGGGQTPLPTLRLLVLGWSGRLPALLSELESYSQETFRITIAGRAPLSLRQELCAQYAPDLERMEIRHVEADYTVPSRLAALNPGEFDGVLCLASDQADSDEEADARTLVAYTTLQSILAESPSRPRILVELLDELNVGLIDPGRSEYLLSPDILSHMLVQVSLRRELNAVFRELFSASEREIQFRDYRSYDLEMGRPVSFGEIQALARAHGEIALGIFEPEGGILPAGGVSLNPGRERICRPGEEDRIVILQ